MNFIDLFAGIGGFHQALTSLGHKCVFAAEIDEYAADTYEKNYNINPRCDITKLDPKTIPSFEILCAGFPCQSFSVGGKRLGFEDKTKGTLFFDVCRILKECKPKYILLENVKNLTSHNDGKTWEVIKTSLIELGYRINHTPTIISPIDCGIPQDRERVYIFGYYDPEHSTEDLNETVELENKNLTLSDIIQGDNDKYKITQYEEDVLNIWNKFVIEMKKRDENISFYILPEYFHYDGDYEGFADWKRKAIPRNIELYNRNKDFLDEWLKEFNEFNFTNVAHKKLEWQSGKYINNIWEGIIQFRQSGIRIRKPISFPTLVAVVQTPIYGPLKRRLSPRECGYLQSFDDSFIICSNEHQAYKQFGNSVNIEVVKIVTKKLLSLDN